MCSVLNIQKFVVVSTRSSGDQGHHGYFHIRFEVGKHAEMTIINTCRLYCTKPGAQVVFPAAAGF